MIDVRSWDLFRWFEEIQDATENGLVVRLAVNERVLDRYRFLSSAVGSATMCIFQLGLYRGERSIQKLDPGGGLVWGWRL